MFQQAHRRWVCRSIRAPAVSVSRWHRCAPHARPLSISSSVAPLPNTVSLPSSCRVLVIGGGVIGCSVAFHLALRQWGADTVLVESHALNAGTSFHAAGLVGQIRRSKQETLLSGVYGTELYERLEHETGQATGFRRCGSISLAQTDDRVKMLRKQRNRAHTYGIQCEFISPLEAQQKWPHMRVDDVKAALWIPRDGVVNATDLNMALAAGARQRDVTIVANTRVLDIKRVGDAHRHHFAVSTNNGVIACEMIALCAGQWSRELALTVGVNVPLHSSEHYYIVSQPLQPHVPTSLPCLRDPDSGVYFREWGSGLAAGGFELKAKPCFTRGVPHDFHFSLLPDDWEQFEPLMQGILHRVPALADIGCKMVNGPESFTSDGNYILGESAECDRFYVAAGLNSSGIASAGGVGKALADWIVDGFSKNDMTAVDIRRFHPMENNINYLRDRTVETLGLHYAIPYPHVPLVSARPMRLTPLHDALSKNNARFLSVAGWERVRFFAQNEHEFQTEDEREGARVRSLDAPPWLHLIAQECMHTRSSASLLDASVVSKLLITGPGARQFLTTFCSPLTPLPSQHKATHMVMLNKRGGIEVDGLLIGRGRDEYLLLTPIGRSTRDSLYLRRRIDSRDNVHVVDMTSAYFVLKLLGPRAQALLAAACDDRVDCTLPSFRYGDVRAMDLGYSSIHVLRTHEAGEDCFNIFGTTDLAINTLQHLQRASISMPEADRMRLIGHDAYSSLRAEAGMIEMDVHFSSQNNLEQTGLLFRNSLSEESRSHLPIWLSKPTQLFMFRLNDPKAHPTGGEVLFDGDRPLVSISSACYGHTVRGAIISAWLSHKQSFHQLQLQVHDEMFSLQPF